MFSRYLFLLGVYLLIGLTSAFAQNTKSYFVGFLPSITIEPFYEEGELDINVFPVVFETPVANQIGLKLTPIVNYHIGGLNDGISDLGVYAVLPYYFKKREADATRLNGFYVGPVFGIGRNVLQNHYTLTLALEPGYLFKAEKSFTIGLGLQLGASYFSYDEKPNKWLTHWGPKVSFGFWIDKVKKKEVNSHFNGNDIQA